MCVCVCHEARCVYLTVGAALAVRTLSSRLQLTGPILTAGVLLTLLHTHTDTHVVDHVTGFKQEVSVSGVKSF